MRNPRRWVPSSAPSRRWRPETSSLEAQRRITLAVEGLRAAFPDETLAIVSGGILLTLYLAAVQNLPTPDPAVWGSIGMPDLAVVDPERRPIIRGFAGHLLA